MSYKSILAVIDEPAECRQVLDVASVLADRFGSHVVGMHAPLEEEFRSVPALDVSYPIEVEAVTAKDEERAKEIEKAFNARSLSDGFASEWHYGGSLASGSEAAIDRFSRCCDLAVMRQPEADGAASKVRRCEHLIFDSGRPVLMIPYILKQVPPISRVLVAWNGTREAARAVFDALPFLTAAKRVEIVTVEREPDRQGRRLPEGTDLAAALARHGVNVAVTREVADGTPAAVIIQNRAVDTGADLLVMGAYTHSRLHERVFGGVTRQVLASMTTLTLLAR